MKNIIFIFYVLSELFFIQSLYGSGFIENKGQWNNDALFLFRGKNVEVWITESAIIFDHYYILNNVEQEDEFSSQSLRRTGRVIKMNFSGESLNPEIIRNGKLSGYYNYYLGNDKSKWVSRVETFKEIILEGIYEGIDLRLYIENANFRYDFLLKPYASVNDITFEIEGAEVCYSVHGNELILSKSDLLIKHGDVKAKSIKYENQNLFNISDNYEDNIDCKFKVYGENRVGFELGIYDHTKELIIDPLVFSTYLGGYMNEEVTDIYADNFQDVYICGTTQSTYFPTIEGSYDIIHNGMYDAFVTKLTASGRDLMYSTFLGGSDDDGATGMKVDTKGNVTVGGYTGSVNYPTSESAYDRTYNGGYDAFVSCLNSDGTALSYSTYFGGFGYDAVNDIVIDNQSNAYITGRTYSDNLPVTDGAFDIYFNGEQDAFVSKISNNGEELLYSTFIGGQGIDIATSIIIDNYSNLYITGQTQSFNYPVTQGAFDIMHNGNTDVFISKFNSSLNNLVYSTFAGGSSIDIGWDIDINGNSEAIVCGETNSDNFPVTPGAFNENKNGAADGFVLKLNNTGSDLVFSTYIGGTYADGLKSVMNEQTGLIYVTGVTGSDDFPVTPDAFDEIYEYNTDGIFCIMNASGSKLNYSSYLGGSNSDYPEAIFVDGYNNVFIGGSTSSMDFPTSSEAYDPTANGQMDGFVFKIDSLDKPMIYTGELQNEICAGEEIFVPYTVSKEFDFGNVFTAQISDAYGDFSEPIDIGSIDSETNGVIVARLPKGLIYGTSYRIRVNGSNPYCIGVANGNDITVNEVPDVAFTGNLNPCVNSSEVYSSEENNNLINKWFVSGGIIQGDSTNFNVSVEWGLNNSGSVGLVRKDITTGCKDTLIKNVEIHNPPLTQISWGKYDVCLNEIVEYTAAASTMSLTEWVVEGGVLLNSDYGSATVQWNSVGNGIIHLIKTNEWGCVGKDIRIVVVNPIPDAGIIGPAAVLSGKSYLYRSEQNDLTGCRWSAKGGVIQGNASNDSVMILWGEEGKGSVRLVEYFTDTDCSDTCEMDIVINPGSGEGVIHGKDEVCEYTVEGYSREENDNAYIKWYVNGGGIIGADNGFEIQVNWQEAGWAKVRYILTYFDSGLKDSSSKAVLINELPNVTLDEFASVCENDNSFILSGGYPGGGAYSGNGVEDDYFYPDIAGPGVHNISYSYTDINGCSNTAIQSITVHKKPEKPVITMKNDTLISNYNEGNQWYKNGDAVEGATGKKYIIKGNGVYSVQVTDSNGCKSEMSLIEVGVETTKINSGIKIYPNPAENLLNINFGNLSGKCTISINDIFGRTLMKLEYFITDDKILNISTKNLYNGFYMINFDLSKIRVVESLLINK
jgi:hypothetical protein